MSERCDVVVLGASGLTGRLVCAHLARRAPEVGLTWAAGGRDPGRVRAALARDGVEPPEVLTADVTDAASLAALATRARVVLNLTGPYTERAEAVIAACVAAGASYADLSGETPFVRRAVARWHDPARDAGVKVVQVAGYEALPFDVAVALAAERARTRAGDGGADGGANLEDVELLVRTTPPPGRLGLSDLVSGGTLASLVAVLRDSAEPGALRLADPALLLPPGATPGHLRRRSPLVLRPRTSRGRLVAPTVPAAFIDPPVVHRTAALLAAERGEAHAPFRYREGVDLGPARGRGAPLRWAAALALAAGQAVLLGLSRLPAPARRVVGGVLERALPPPGTGPSGPQLEDWSWSVDLRATTSSGAAVRVAVDARGHPGYTATARMLAELGLLLATPGATPERAGCLTPAAALGTGSLDAFAASGVRFTASDG